MLITLFVHRSPSTLKSLVSRLNLYFTEQLSLIMLCEVFIIYAREGLYDAAFENAQVDLEGATRN